MSRRYILEGSFVVVPGRVAFLLERNYRLDELRRAAWGQDRETYEVCQAIKAVALTWEAEATTPDRPVVATGETTGHYAADDGFVMSTAHVSGILGDIGQPGVAKAARENRLVGTKNGRTWEFTRQAVAVFAATRPRERDL